MVNLGSVVGIVLIGLALFSVVAVMWFVVREKHEHEEHYEPETNQQPYTLDSRQAEGEIGSPNIHAALEQQVKPDENVPQNASPNPEAYELDSRQVEGEVPPMDAQQAAEEAANPDQPNQD
jgi:hypothetical protein